MCGVCQGGAGPLLDHGGAEREEHPRHRLRAAQEELRQVAVEGNKLLNLSPFLLHYYQLVNTFYSCVFIKLSYLSNNFSSALFWNYILNFLGFLDVLCLCTMEFKIFKFYLI